MRTESIAKKAHIFQQTDLRAQVYVHVHTRISSSKHACGCEITQEYMHVMPPEDRSQGMDVSSYLVLAHTYTCRWALLT
jgi:hypothetical protein